ncbi:unnamed protein product, partial [Amoebophrya sp. A25]
AGIAGPCCACGWCHQTSSVVQQRSGRRARYLHPTFRFLSCRNSGTGPRSHASQS